MVTSPVSWNKLGPPEKVLPESRAGFRPNASTAIVVPVELLTELPFTVGVPLAMMPTALAVGLRNVLLSITGEAGPSVSIVFFEAVVDDSQSTGPSGTTASE